MATSSATTKKKTTTRRTSSKKKKNTRLQEVLIGLLMVLLGVLIFLSLVSNAMGVAGSAIRQFILGIFGIGGFLVPFIVVFAGVQLIINKKKLKLRVILASLFTLVLSAFYNVICFTIPARGEGTAFSDYLSLLTEELYVDGYTNLSSGGVLGGYLAVPLTNLCSPVGAGIIFGVIILLALLPVIKLLYDKISSLRIELPEGGSKEEPVKAGDKAVAKELKNIRKEVEELRIKQEKELKAAEKAKKEISTEEDLDRELDDIEKPYKEAAEKASRRLRNKKSADIILYTDEDDPSPVSVGPTPAVLGENPEYNAEDMFIPESVKPRKGEAVETEDIVIDDPLREMILKKVSEAEAKADEDAFAEETALQEVVAEVEKKPEIEESDTPTYIYPPISLLTAAPKAAVEDSVDELHRTAEKLMEALRTFNVETKVLDFSRGPTVTRYELQPLPGVKISRITNLADDIALHLAATAVRLEAPIPGKAAIGVEIPNKSTTMVYLQEIISSDEFKNAKSALSVCLGKDISGNGVVIDLAKMPHLLIAGATGSGKSVCINTLIISLIYKSSPEDVRLILVDPKMVELNVYNGIPHLLIPVVTDSRKASGALSWAVSEMLKRYDLFKEKGVRDFAGYNRNLAEGETKLPQIVIIIDEMADLMMVSRNEVEDAVCRLAQMARAAGMHLVIATQRPSADVLTGTIKTNIPSRIAFAVSSQIDSRIILDSSGAEKLVGKGDMLYDPLGATKPLRIQGCFVSDKEVENVTSFIKSNYTAEYDEEVIKSIEQKAKEQEKGNKGGDEVEDDDDDPMLPQAIEVVVNAGQASTSTLQRKLKLGYARAARIMDQMEERGIIGEYQGSKPREVLISRQEWLEMKARWDGNFN